MLCKLADVILLDNMALGLSFSRSFRVVTHIIPKDCEKSKGLGKFIYYLFFNNRFIFVKKLILGISSSCGASSTHGTRIL